MRAFKLYWSDRGSVPKVIILADNLQDAMEQASGRVAITYADRLKRVDGERFVEGIIVLEPLGEVV